MLVTQWKLKVSQLFLKLDVDDNHLSLCRDHAESAIEIINRIVPKDHLLLASSKRVKGRDYIKLYGVTARKIIVAMFYTLINILLSCSWHK